MNAVFSLSSGTVAIAEPDYPENIATQPATDALSPVYADTYTELLRTIAEVLDIRIVFPRVSEIVKDLLPHDALKLTFHDRSGRVTLEACSTDDIAGPPECAGPDRGNFYTVSDLRRMKSRSAVEHLLAAGYRSLLNVRSMARDQAIRLGFFSRQPDAYGADNERAARHIADLMAVAIAHEQLASAESDRAEARG